MENVRQCLMMGAVATSVVLLLAGCSTTQQHAAGTASGNQEKVVMCSKCQMVWVRRPHQVGKAVVYRKEQAMECPDCKSAVVNFFTTGKWQHTCATCGDKLAECAVCR